MDLSIIILAYNYEKYIKECIDSCVFQKDPKLKYEIIIIDDGSTDNTKEILSKINDKNIHVHTTKNQGIEIAANLGYLGRIGHLKWHADL